MVLFNPYESPSYARFTVSQKYFCVNSLFHLNMNDLFPLLGINEYSSLEKFRLLQNAKINMRKSHASTCPLQLFLSCSEQPRR